MRACLAAVRRSRLLGRRPYPAFAELRRDDPVHRYEGEAGSFWAIARHADVQHVSKHPDLFCSGKGVLLTDLTRPVVSTDSILYLDPPLHAKRRKLLSPSLTVRRVADLEDRVRAIVDRAARRRLTRARPVDARRGDLRAVASAW